MIEILALLALAHAAQGDIPLALVFLERALTLAEPKGYIRFFVDEGSNGGFFGRINASRETAR
jgi:LuxR family maltose regulon positive regulatory protein